MLSLFDRVFAVSDASRRELEAFWRWQEVVPRSEVARIELGADFLPANAKVDLETGRAARRENLNTPRVTPRLLCVGILEPRKNQTLLLDVAEQLVSRKVNFELNLVGRVNPHFGRPILRRMQKLASTYPQIRYHGAASDKAVTELWGSARACVFPTLAEGCGLPLLESLARGVPCVASDLPVLRESGEGGGCVFAKVNDRETWLDTLTKILTDDSFCAELATQAKARKLPNWSDAAEQLLENLS
jgi:glycosyltransferase involved in cell wall biosynthesis